MRHCGNCKHWCILRDENRDGKYEFGVCSKMVENKSDAGEILDTIYWKGNDGSDLACDEYEDVEDW